MPRCRFVAPESVRLELSEGDWIEVKARLTYGEQQRVTNAALGKVSGKLSSGITDEVTLDLAHYAVERMLVWLVDWSFIDPRGKVAPINRDTITALDPETVSEIERALDAHIEAQAEAAKNAMTPG